MSIEWTKRFPIYLNFPYAHNFNNNFNNKMAIFKVIQGKVESKGTSSNYLSTHIVYF